MINFTAGARNIQSAMKAGQINRIITAHKFIEIGALEPLIEQLVDTAEFVYLEDVREGLGLGDKIAGALGPVLPRLFRSPAHHEKTGVVLFTSGTEGEPKGCLESQEPVGKRRSGSGSYCTQPDNRFPVQSPADISLLWLNCGRGASADCRSPGDLSPLPAST